MGILKDLTQKLGTKSRASITERIAGIREGFTEPPRAEVCSRFCDPGSSKFCVTVCSSKSECQCGCEAVRQALVNELSARGLAIEVGPLKTGCSGACGSGPIVGFPQKQFFYVGMSPSDVSEIVEETIIAGRLLFPFLSINPERSFRGDVFYDKKTGLLAAVDESVCMVDAAKYFLDFEEGLSCGKCVPCRIGMKRTLECIRRITEGVGTAEDLEQVKTLCNLMDGTPNCDFAVTSIRPVLSAITYFEEEFRAHIDQKTCAAGVCAKLVALQKKRAIRERLAKTK